MSDESQVQIKRRRLNELKKKAARFGYNTQPEVSMEIEDLEREIAQLEAGAEPVPTSPEPTRSTPSTQTNITGNVTGPVLSGTFSGPVSIGGSSVATGSPEPAQQVATILVAFAQPQGLPATQWEQEARELRSILTPFAQSYRLLERSNLTPEDLYEALLNLHPTMLHFQGHGTSDGLVFSDSQGDAVRVSWKAVMRTLSTSETLTCAILNACESSVHAQVGPQRFHLITMRGAVSTEIARVFTSGFYKALVAGRAIPQAFNSACNLLALRGFPEDEWPMLTRALE
jgi:hypothetical protein